MHSSALIAGIAALTAPAVQALGINCRGSGLCHLASWENKAPESVMQVLRDAVWQSNKVNDTAYNNGEHIICIAGKQSVTLSGSDTYNSPQTQYGSGSVSGTFSLSGSIATGGICLFAQGLTAPALNLGDIRPLTDKLLEHGCGTCGSVPVHFVDQGSNDPKDGILTFNYVKNPYCTGKCISAEGTNGNTPTSNASANTAPASMASSAKFRRFAA